MGVVGEVGEEEGVVLDVDVDHSEIVKQNPDRNWSGFFFVMWWAICFPVVQV